MLDSTSRSSTGRVLAAAVFYMLAAIVANGFHLGKSPKMSLYRRDLCMEDQSDNSGMIPMSPISRRSKFVASSAQFTAALLGAGGIVRALAVDPESTTAATAAVEPIIKDIAVANAAPINFGDFKLPYEHVNIPFKDFLGTKATIVFNMKIDDPQTVLQFPDLREIYAKYSKDGLNVHAFPTEQGWFEPDDDETCRAKSIEYYGFGGDYPRSVVFDKVDVLGPSAHPLFAALTSTLPTPNGYGRITLNYEKFLLDASGKPVRRYPRKYSAYDMENDIVAMLKGQPLPEETALYQKAWREAKREAVKSEYSFRYNYNYYTAPESMYKYNPGNDQKI